MEERNVYFIPDNFVEDEKVLNGKFKKRNFIEACVVAILLFGFFYFLEWATGIGWSTLGYVAAFVAIAVLSVVIIGYNGDSWGETIVLAFKFRKNKYSISTYNPRIKTELTADYLNNPSKNSRAEIIKNFINNLNVALAGTKNSGEIADELVSDKIIYYYEEDEGIVEKPTVLKTPDELKRGAKEAKKKAREKKKKQNEYLMTLGPKERKIQRAKFKAEALEEKERLRKQQEEELKRYHAAIAEREIEEAKKAKETYEAENLEKQKRLTEKQIQRQKQLARKKEIRELRKQNTLKEKEEARLEKEKKRESKKKAVSPKGKTDRPSSKNKKKKNKGKEVPIVDLGIEFGKTSAKLEEQKDVEKTVVKFEPVKGEGVPPVAETTVEIASKKEDPVQDFKPHTKEEVHVNASEPDTEPVDAEAGMPGSDTVETEAPITEPETSLYDDGVDENVIAEAKEDVDEKGRDVVPLVGNGINPFSAGIHAKMGTFMNPYDLGGSDKE